MQAVTFEQVSKSWGSVVALGATDLAIPAHQFTVLLGPSGCGKTTTLRLIAGLEAPTSGQIQIFGRDVTHTHASARGVSMVFQSYALFPHLSVAENIVFGLRVRKLPQAVIDQKLKHVIDLLGLRQQIDRKPAQLSGGQQQRVALARALVADSQLCLMDEPLSNLDAQLRQEMRQELRALQQTLNLSVVYVTHDQIEAMSMADQVVLLNAGRVEQVAKPVDLYQRPASLFAAKFIGQTPMNIWPLDGHHLQSSTLRVQPPAGAKWLGVRPEALLLNATADQVFEGRIKKIEYTGADALVTLTSQGLSLIARIAGEAMTGLLGSSNASIGFGWASSAQHWFDEHGAVI